MTAPTPDPDRAAEEFARAAAEPELPLWKEFLVFLSESKKWWLLPIILVLLAVVALMLFTGTGLAPFIYPMM